MNMKVVNLIELLNHSESGDFLNVLPFNSSSLGAVDIQGESPVWEMHPDTDELFYVIEGALEIELLADSGREVYTAKANETMVVPKGYWHKPKAPEGAKFIYLTPGQSLHSDKNDPRD